MQLSEVLQASAAVQKGPLRVQQPPVRAGWLCGWSSRRSVVGTAHRRVPTAATRHDVNYIRPWRINDVRRRDGGIMWLDGTRMRACRYTTTRVLNFVVFHICYYLQYSVSRKNGPLYLRPRPWRFLSDFYDFCTSVNKNEYSTVCLFNWLVAS